MRELNRLVWAEGTCLESYEVRIGIRASRPDVMDRLVPSLPPEWHAIEPPRRLDTLYSWVVGGERRPNVRAFEIMYGRADVSRGRLSRRRCSTGLRRTFG